MVSSEEIKRRLEEKKKTRESSSFQEESTSKKTMEAAPEIPPETAKYCPNCDVEFTEEANFCPDCGTPLQDVPSAGGSEELSTDTAEDYESEISEVPEYEEEMVEEGTDDYVKEPVEEYVEEDEQKPRFTSKSMPYTPSTITGDITVVSSNYVPGYKSVKTLGFVYGLTVRSRGLGGQIGAGIRSMFGGEIKEYVKMMEHARQEALNRMIDHAREMGANAVISARFDSDEISDIMQEILAYGTAVIIEKEEKND